MISFVVVVSDRNCENYGRGFDSYAQIRYAFVLSFCVVNTYIYVCIKMCVNILFGCLVLLNCLVCDQIAVFKRKTEKNEKHTYFKVLKSNLKKTKKTYRRP